MTRTAYNAAGVIAEARALGLDVTAAAVDVQLLALNAERLASHPKPERERLVALMNDGCSYWAARHHLRRTL